MEDQQQSVLFSVGIDDVTQLHLKSIAKWNRFLAIIGIIVSALIIIVLVLGGSFIVSALSGLGGNRYETAGYASNAFSVLIFVYVILVAIYLIPCFFRLSFSNKMLKALMANDQQLLNDSFSSLRTYSKYWGIVTIIVLGFYILVFVLGLLGAMMR